VVARLRDEATYYGESATHTARVAALAQLAKILGMTRDTTLPAAPVNFVFMDSCTFPNPSIIPLRLYLMTTDHTKSTIKPCSDWLTAFLSYPEAEDALFQVIVQLKPSRPNALVVLAALYDRVDPHPRLIPRL